jgi:hypothetical protein
MERERGTVRRVELFAAVSMLLASAAVSFGQEARVPTKPNIEILKLHWERQVRLPRNFDPSVISTGRTFSDPASSTASGAPTTAIDSTRAATSAQSASAGSSTAFPATPSRLPVFYVYSMKFENRGSRPIEGVAWDYIFIDPTSNAELGRHQFLSYERVVSGKRVTFESQLRSPPTRIVQASDSHAHRSRLVERAVIQCVLYDDGTTWQNPTAAADICNLLRNGKTLMKRKHGPGQGQ